jgi:hypothetical protein
VPSFVSNTPVGWAGRRVFCSAEGLGWQLIKAMVAASDRNHGIFALHFFYADVHFF